MNTQLDISRYFEELKHQDVTKKFNQKKIGLNVKPKPVQVVDSGHKKCIKAKHTWNNAMRKRWRRNVKDQKQKQRENLV